MPVRIEPSLFARVMALPDGAREDILEFFGGSPIESTCLEALIEGISEDIHASRQRDLEPN